MRKKGIIEAERYRHLNKFFKEKYGERVLKICIDGGFTCPNRDGKCGYGGCIFCSERGSGEHIKYRDISQQVTNFLSSYRGERANKFIAYFQNFTNTYADVKTLKAKYDASLISPKIVALDIATRPDCIDEEVAKLLQSYKEKYDVYVELGLQTSNEKTGLLINRGYTNKDFDKAVNILNKYNIPIVVHIMLGLPQENDLDLANTVSFINKYNISGIKIHSTYVVKNTYLEKLYLDGTYKPLELDDYIKKVCFVLTHINSRIVIHRISGDAPKDMLVAPSWNLHKKWVINGIDKFMRENDLYQGKYFKSEN